MVEPWLLNKGPIETDLDLRVHDEKWTTGPIEELVEVSVNVKKPTRVLNIGKNLSQDKLDELLKFLWVNLDTFA